MTEKFAVEQATLIAEIERKYAKDIQEMEKSTDQLKAKIYNKLLDKKAKEKKEKLVQLQQNQKKEKAQLNNDYKEKIKNLNKEEKLKEFAEKIKRVIKTSPSPTQKNHENDDDDVFEEEYKEESQDKIDFDSITLSSPERFHFPNHSPNEKSNGISPNGTKAVPRKRRQPSIGYISIILT